ncbi:plant-specific GATA-type zinc finger transcription factor family protein [Actinidia rufa]|uniref:Plant-specific GATA-type zinc finger transcription factor family protein n=1 Tax=Actinidia rufa TaxID=165716 RepID=A0A7J0DHP6_9ERIC|nr:plant-specific GATA-type zinc finger transcription factor family protein [Actinidia rufa]
MGCGLGSGRCADFPSIWANPPAALPGSDPILSNNNSASDLSAELSIPVSILNLILHSFKSYEDIVQLEWLSNFVEDSFSGGGMTLEKGNTSITKALPHNHFHTSSPVSVLESSSSSTSSSGGKKMLPVPPGHSVGPLDSLIYLPCHSTLPAMSFHWGLGHGPAKVSGTTPLLPKKMLPVCQTQHGPHRAHSKRPRPAAFNPRPAIQLASPTSSEFENLRISPLPIP